MAAGSVDQDGSQAGTETRFDIVFKAVADEQNLGSRQADRRHGCVKDLAIGFGVAGLAGKRNCIEKVSDTETVHDRIDAGIEVRDDAQFELAALQFLKYFNSLGKKDPALGVSKLLINLIEKPIEVLDHSDVVENAVHNVLPPAFLIVERERARALEMTKKCFLDNVGRNLRPVLARDAAVDFTDRSASREQGFGSIKEDGAKFQLFGGVMAVHLNFKAVQINDRASVIILGPGDTDDEGSVCRDQFGTPGGRRVPFAQDMGTETLYMKELAYRRYGVLIRAVPVFPEVVSFKKLLDSSDPLRLHKGLRF